jgi:hypothetical protein
LPDRFPPDEPGTRERILAASEVARRFHAAGGYDAVATLRAACEAAGVSYVCIAQLYDDATPDEGRSNYCEGRLYDDADMALSVSMMAAEDRFEDILTGLAAALAVPVGPQGDGDLTEGG